MAGLTHVGDIGTIFRIHILDNGAPLDISTATTKEILFQKPNGAGLLTKVASFGSGGGVDGVIEYMSVMGDLDTEGTWRVQAHVVLPTGDWHSGIGSFIVEANLS